MGIWKSKVRFIGAGAIGIAAIWTLITLIKPIIEGMKISVKSMTALLNAKRIAWIQI